MKQMKVKESMVVTESKCETVFCWLESYKKFWGSRVKETEKKNIAMQFSMHVVRLELINRGENFDPEIS